MAFQGRFGPISRIKSCSRGHDRNTRHHICSDLGSSQTFTPTVEDPYQIAGTQVSFFCIPLAQQDWLSSTDLTFPAMRRMIKLAVKPSFRLMRHKVQRVRLRCCRTQPFFRLQPGRMARTIWIAKAPDGIRRQFDFS